MEAVMKKLNTFLIMNIGCVLLAMGVYFFIQPPPLRWENASSLIIQYFFRKSNHRRKGEYPLQVRQPDSSYIFIPEGMKIKVSPGSNPASKAPPEPCI